MPSSKVFLTFTEWSKELGPMFAVRLMSREVVVLNSYDLINEALVQKGSQLHGRPNKGKFRLQMVLEDFSNIFSGQPDNRWKKMRKVFHQKIRMYDTGLIRIEEISNQMLGNLVEDFKSQQGKSFDPKDIIYHTIMCTIVTLLLGKTFNKDDDIYQKIFHLEQTLIQISSTHGKGKELDLFPWLRFLGNATYKKLLSVCKVRDEVLQRLVQAAEEDGAADGEEDVRLVTALQQTVLNDPSLSERHARGVGVFDTFFAGTTTTSNSTYVYMNIISQHPEVQKKLQQEVDQVVGPGRTVRLADREAMPYTHATMLELLRYSSIVPLGVPHCAVEDTVIGGYTIPAGTPIFLNLFALLHDEELWEKPYDFLPERFLDESGQVVSASHPNRRHLMPFGGGPFRIV
jgi:cytochrome P450 family 2 subfamily U polypeptide 1